MLDEELELPRQLLDVERDAVRRIVVRPQRLAALLHAGDERHGLAIERGVLGGGRRAEVRLQRDVAEILEAEHAELVGVMQDRAAPAAALRASSRATATNGIASNRSAPGAAARTIGFASFSRTRK